MLIDHIISRIYNSRIRDVILIDDNITLLDYGHHQFIGSLHVVDSRSRIRASSRCYLHRALECN